MHKSFKRCCVILAVLALTEFAKAAKARLSKQTLAQNSNICQFQPNGALLDNPLDCQKFYLCLERQAFEYSCYSDHFYDGSERRCVKGTTCASSFNTTVSCKDGNIRPVPDNCNKFEACINGEYQKLNCLPNYYFNAQKSICVPFKNDAEFKCNCLMPEYTVMPNKNNCETYFVCHQKSAVVENCPLGQYYNATLNTCIIDLHGVCLTKPTVTSVHANQIKNDSETSCRHLGLNNIHFQTFAKGCNTFYNCVNGHLITQHCPKNFYYDSDKKYCKFDVSNRCLDTEEQK